MDRKREREREREGERESEREKERRREGEREREREELRPGNQHARHQRRPGSPLLAAAAAAAGDAPLEPDRGAVGEHLPPAAGIRVAKSFRDSDRRRRRGATGKHLPLAEIRGTQSAGWGRGGAGPAVRGGAAMAARRRRPPLPRIDSTSELGAGRGGHSRARECLPGVVYARQRR